MHGTSHQAGEPCLLFFAWLVWAGARVTFTLHPSIKGWVMGINGPFILPGRAHTH